MESHQQERKRMDNKLYNWKMNSQCYDLISTYKLLH